jgi:hypothetical protein
VPRKFVKGTKIYSFCACAVSLPAVYLQANNIRVICQGMSSLMKIACS